MRTAGGRRLGRVGALARSAAGLGSRDPVARYAARHHLAGTVAHRLGGFRIYNRDLAWSQDQDFLAAWRSFPEGGDVVKDRRYVLWSFARSVVGLPGHTAECGVYNGSSSWLICSAGEWGPGWRHHMFDSFEGLSAPDDRDEPVVDDDRTYRWQEHDLSVGVDRVAANMSAFGDAVQLHPGWIPSAFGAVADDAFCLVHIDVDLYQPTYDSLAWFYERMVPGGVILCDDYGYTTCPGARAAFDEFIADKPERTVVELPTGQGFIVKR